MPDSRVNKIVKGLFIALAKAKPEVLSPELASKFTAKSMRCGGTSAASAGAVRDAVLQGHGGWLNRKSLVHYDLMTESEKALVSSSLNAAVAGAKLTARARQSQRAGEQQQLADAPITRARNPSGQLRSMAAADSEDEQQESDEEQDYEQQFKIQAIVGMRSSRRGRQFRVQWRPCKENGFNPSECTWESEDQLHEDGQKARLAQFLRAEGAAAGR